MENLGSQAMPCPAADSLKLDSPLDILLVVLV